MNIAATQNQEWGFWRPIDTAPMNGTRMLLCAEIHGRPFVFTGGYDSHWSGKCWVADHPRVSSGFKPTHWAPLPDPPSVMAGLEKERA